jgi:chemotaxis signal transduction protein
MDSLLSSLLANFDSVEDHQVTPPRQGSSPAPVIPPAKAPFFEQPARPSAVSLPPTSNHPLGRKFIAVTVGSHNFALPIESVLEVGRCPRITFVPGLADHVRGVFSFRGEVIPAIGIRTMASLPELEKSGGPESQTESSRIVVVQSANGGNRAALIFDSLEGIVSIDIDAPGFAASHARFKELKDRHPLAASLSSMCEHEAVAYALLSIDRLLQEAGCMEGTAAR